MWHVPLHLTGYYEGIYGTAVNGILQHMLSAVPLAIMFTWLYNRSQGNLLIMVLLHTAIDVTSGINAPAIGLFISTTLAVLLMVIFDRMHRKRPAEAIQSPVELSPAS